MGVMADTESTRCETLLAFYQKSIKDDSGLWVLNEYLAQYVCILCSHTESVIDIYFGQLRLMNMHIDQDY